MPKNKHKKEVEVVPCISLQHAKDFINFIDNSKCKEVIITLQKIEGPVESELDSEQPIRVDQLKHLVNTRIDMDPSTDLKHAMKLLQTMNEELGIKSSVIICSNCAKKIGVKRCSGCSKTSEIRYCSKECQVAAWPSHKGCCGL
jgi:hypothetical protein